MTSDVDPNCINSGGVTALGLAAQLGYVDVIDLLIQVKTLLRIFIANCSHKFTYPIAFLR